MLTNDVYTQPGVEEALAGYVASAESGIMKGVDEEFALHRVARS